MDYKAIARLSETGCQDHLVTAVMVVHCSVAAYLSSVYYPSHSSVKIMLLALSTPVLYVVALVYLLGIMCISSPGGRFKVSLQDKNIVAPVGLRFSYL